MVKGIRKNKRRKYVKGLLALVLAAALCLQGTEPAGVVKYVRAASMEVSMEVSDDSLWTYDSYVDEDTGETCAVITGYSGDYASAMNIPEEVTIETSGEVAKVTGVGAGEKLFSSNYSYSIESIIIPESVTSIGDSAFYDCYGLTEITIPESVTSIGNSAFYDCYGLTEIRIPDSVTSIGDYAFYYCSSLTEITIPDSVTSIGASAFYYCSSLTEITIPESVTSIGASAFYDCSSLTEIRIPDSVTSIGDHAFYYCSSLTEIRIPDSVTSIGASAFGNCDGLTEIRIPDSVTSIGAFVFGACSSLTEITIPESVTSIGDSAFNWCSSLTEITIPDGVTSIGDFAFSGCSSLTEITIPDGVTSIGDYAFSWCSSLTEITIPESVTSIGDSAFSDCSSLIIYTSKESYAASYATEQGYSVRYLDDYKAYMVAWDRFFTTAVSSFSISEPFKVGVSLEYNGNRATGIVNALTVSEDGKYTISYEVKEAIDSFEEICLITNIKEMQKLDFFTIDNFIVQYADGGSCTVEVNSSEENWCKRHSLYAYRIIKGSYNATDGTVPDLLPGDVIQLSFAVSGMSTEAPPEETKIPVASAVPPEETKIPVASAVPPEETGTPVASAVGPVAPDPVASVVPPKETKTPVASASPKASITPTGSSAPSASVVPKVSAAPQGSDVPVASAGPKISAAPSDSGTTTVNRKNQTIKASSITKTYSKKSFAIPAKTSGDGALSFSSSNSKVVAVSASGSASIKGYGTAKITITAAQTAAYNRAEKQITVKIIPKQVKITGAASPARGRLRIKWKKDKTVTGYQYSIVGGRMSLSKTSSKVMVQGGAQSGTRYTVRVRAFKKVGKKIYYGKWSLKKIVRVK